MEHGPYNFELPYYPVDKSGLPIAPQELSHAFDEVETDEYTRYERHRLAYVQQLFARHAIAETFRNLDSNSLRMTQQQHELLHDHWQGIETLPPAKNMLTVIEREHDTGGQLLIFDVLGHRYIPLPITDIHLKQLHYVYNELPEELR